ncbi:hypothetical protein M407DRAFT_20228 [Tulasnella calospora MUT 4182]|uniref:Zn(2)-C6 fungal-type domain-containing protein n=1 Tax=Tulasnella calospora MUT 4182 TaxID=1051891 RepID=A0A0C3L9W2_9AGAM|nr:hypothetical protein M407DRAFT_20228 [Tulasnella calospora MUT 4182]
MDQNYFPHFAHPHSSSQHQYLDQQQFACQSQEFYIPPPQQAHPVVCDATFAEAAQRHQHQAFLDSSQLDPFANAEEGGPIGWVPPEERGFQHQAASNAIGTGNEVSVGYPTVDQQQPQFAPTPFQQQSPSNWSQQVQHVQQQQQPQPATANLTVYQMAGEAVAFHHHRVQVPQDLSSDLIAGQPQSTGNITNPQAPISMLAPQAVYPSTLLDPSSPSVAFHQHQQHAVGGSTQGYPHQSAVPQGYNGVQVQHQPHSHEGNLSSHPVYSTSSAAPSTGMGITTAAANPGVAPSPSSSASSSESLYPAGVYQQTACGSSESMAILNGAVPHHQQQAQIPHQQQLYSASGSYEVQSQYLAHHPPTSARAQTFHSGLSDSNAASNFITSPTAASSSASSSNPTHGAAVCVQQPQPLAPSRTSSLAAWADVPPTPISGPEHAPVMALGVQEYHYQQYHHQLHHQTEAVKEEQGIQFQQQGAYSPVQQQQQPQMMKIEDIKPQLHQAPYGAQDHALKPVSPQVLSQHPHHPGMSRSSTDVGAPRVQAQPLSRSATMPDMSASQRANPNASSANNTAALAPTRSVAEFDVAPRPVEAIKASETVRQAAKLHIDLGQADPNSPTSHEARLKARSLRRKGSAAPPAHGYSPYQREYAARRGSSASQHDQAEHAHHQQHQQQQPIVPSSRPTTALPTDQYGAQRTFIFNPYQDPSTLAAESGKQGHIPHGVPLPTPSVTAVVSGAPATAQHQTIEFSGSAESMSSPEDLGKGKALDRSSAADAAALMMGEKKPFLACGFCRQRKIACGQRAPHPRDNEIGEGPRTCNQCARRHILCSFPSESRRGLRKTKPVTKTIVQEDGTEVTIIVEDEEEIEELEPPPSKKQSKSKKKGRGPMEWIIAADAWLITPAAWAAHKAALEKKTGEGNGSMPGSSSGAQNYQPATYDDSSLSAGPSASAVHV